MKKTALALTLIVAFLTSMVAGTPFANLASAQSPEIITINADGSIDPATAPIQRNGDVYTLVGDIDGFVVLARNNTILDGAGHTVEGISGPPVVWVDTDWQTNSTVNLTIVNAVINEGWIAIVLLYNSIVANNTLNNSGMGINWHGEGNIISGNNITNCNYTGGAIAVGGSNNTIIGNYIAGTNGTAINLGTSSDNTIVGNQIEDNKVGISTTTIYSQGGAQDNMIYYNNFINNTQNVYNEVILAGPVAVSIWDNGAVGNYWSDYNGTDADGDGIGDTPYVIDASNQDRYPLMTPVDITHINPPSPSPSPSPSPTPTPTPSPTPNPTDPTPTPSPTASPSPESTPEIPEFSSWILLPLLITVVIGVGLLVYFKKRKR